MTTESNLDARVHQLAPEVHEQLIKAASRALTEEDLRIATHEVLSRFATSMGFHLEGRHEVSFGAGRADSVYDAVIVEYKRPKRLTGNNKSAGNAEAIGQLRRRFEQIATRQKRRLEHTFGVAFDGHYFIFLRSRGGVEHLWEPQILSEASTELLLRRLASLGKMGRAFTAANLDVDFGARSPLTRSAVRDLWSQLNKPNSPRTSVLLAQWELMFQEVCGYDLKSPSKSAKELCQHYKTPVSTTRELLFALHTYYSIIIKLIAAEILGYYHHHPSFIGRIGASSQSGLQHLLASLEAGGIYRQLGIANLLEGNLFSWYTDEWSPDVARSMHQMIMRMGEYDPGTLSIEPDETEDLLKEVYQQLLPESLRHDLGEFYTPDWLAELTLARAGYDGRPESRILDPACGSGTFLIRAIEKIRARCADEQRSPKETLRLILANVTGFDLNPLAVMSARVNYIIALRDLLAHVEGSITVPVFLCDALMTPHEPGDLFQEAVEIRTAVGPWSIARSMLSAERLSGYVRLLEDSVALVRPSDEFMSELSTTMGFPDHERSYHEALYKKLLKLQQEKRNGVWARIIRNGFAPLFADKFDFVVGNPPWVNWEHLPQVYRRESENLWRQYGLFTLSGAQARLGGGKKDLSMLFVYVGMDRYLRHGGRLSFVLSQGLFKSDKAGAGFRKNYYQATEKKRVVFQVLHADDFVRVAPFKTATTRAVVVAYKKGAKTTFPIAYSYWTKSVRGNVPDTMSWRAARILLNEERQVAESLRKGDDGAQWLTGKRELIEAIREAIGKSSVYQAYAGTCTWLNGVYWVEKLRDGPGDTVVISNIHDVGKIHVPRVDEVVLERRCLHRLLRGRDVHRWRGVPSGLMLQMNDPDLRSGWEEVTLRKDAPRTYKYLLQFREILILRSGYVKYFADKRAPFYSIHNVGPYTVAPYKVVWKEQSNVLEAAVIGPDEDGKAIIPDHKLMLVPARSLPEAHYLCAMLNSSAAGFIVVSYVLGISISNSTHVLRHVPIPRFRARDPRHARLAALSSEAHKRRAEDASTTDLEEEVDRLACVVMGLDPGLACGFRAEVDSLA